MIQLDLNPSEQAVLIDVLENYLSDLHTEISHTDSHDYRDRLKERQHAVSKALEGLRHKAPAQQE
ncbi:MAG TPA: hypothetical protein VFG50_13770 [Rhodothermales bacterium]|nr:hypothetical protein [Rhodothermales bacterium]